MSLLSRTLSSLVVVGLLAVAPPSHASQPDRTRPVVVHRVVWDAGSTARGIHLRSALRDGTQRKDVYDQAQGFTLDLTLDRAGRRVAFAPCCQSRFPQMVVVPVLGGKALTPLAHHREIVVVGGIGWSPDGRRLVFEGGTDTGSGPLYEESVWTIRPNGTGLRRLIKLPPPPDDQPVINDALAWTPRGILYSDGNDLRIARHGRSRLVIRHVFSVQISGDGRSIVTSRYVGRYNAYWISRPDGSHARRLFVNPEDAYHGYTSGVIPSFDGSRVIAARQRRTDQSSVSDVVVWNVARGVGSARVLPFIGSNYVVTWN